MPSKGRFTIVAVTASALAGAVALSAGLLHGTAQAAAVAGPCGGPTSGDCCFANGTPGCNDTDCCTLICGIDPFCCSNTWDGICADQACGIGGLCFPPEPVVDFLATSATPAPNQVQFGAADIPAIPADFFGPGSDPFDGIVPFMGVPLDPGVTEDASVAMQRANDPVFPFEPQGTSGTVPVEMVEMNLRSIDPVTVTFNGGQSPELWSMEVTLSDQPTPPGQLTALKTHPNGGTFDADFFVHPVFTFVKTDDPDQVRVIDTVDFGIPPMHLFISGGNFVHFVNPLLEIVLPKLSQWAPGILEIVPGDPNSQVPTGFTASSDGGGVQHTVEPASTKDGRCELVSKTIPANQTACTTSTNGDGTKNVRVSFGMNASFRDNCSCCEYRQNVKGEFKYKGKKVPHQMNPGVFLQKDTFNEDGFGVPTPAGSNANYGRRGDAQNPAHDRYLNPAVRGAGCTYAGTDAPGMSNMQPGAAYSFNLAFEGTIIDSCNGTTLQTNTWTVNCAGTAFGPPADPLIEVLTETIINGTGAVLGVYLYPGDVLTVVGSFVNGVGEEPPIDSAGVDITIGGLDLFEGPDSGPLPETRPGGSMAHAVFNFDFPPGSPPDLLVSFTFGPETQLIAVTLPAVCPWDCGGDINGDVGIVDFLALLGQWGGPGTCDFDGGGVSIVDFLDLLGHWGPCP